MKISSHQLKLLAEANNKRYLIKTAKEIEKKMDIRIPYITKHYDQKNLLIDIHNAVIAANLYDIDDQEQLYDWCVIRIVSKMEFYNMDEFKYILDHNLLVPFAKARHIILIFFTIVGMQQGEASWQ